MPMDVPCKLTASMSPRPGCGAALEFCKTSLLGEAG